MNDVTDNYLSASIYVKQTAQDHLILQTAKGLTPIGQIANPVFFDGRISRPDVAAAGLLSLVEIASKRYFNPAPTGIDMLDPIVTANGDRLRCEVFSACNGVYARLDLLGQIFNDAALGFGTTNIDINPPLSVALAGISMHDRLHLSVGPSQINFTTNDAHFVERKVKMPERWIRGLGETQSIATQFHLQAQLDAIEWRRFFHSLPTSGGSGAGASMWLTPTLNGFRATSKSTNGAISLAGAARLSAVKNITHLIQSVNVYGPSTTSDTKAAASAWEFLLPGARLIIMLSPEPYRGFSGEGALLHALSQAQSDDALIINALLAWDANIHPQSLAEESQIPKERVLHALQLLAAHGQVGFDLHEQGYFHRQVPQVEARLEMNYPRLVAAKELIKNKSVSGVGARIRVLSDELTQWVGFANGIPSCTCIFWSKHRGSRGPCKHILAAQLYLETTL
jgi:hypothetical protein